MLKRTTAITKQARELYEREVADGKLSPGIAWDRMAPASQEAFITRIYERLKHTAIAEQKQTYKLPTIRQEPRDQEPARAQWWRQRIVRLKVEELATLTGYTAQTIYLMERGVAASGALTSPWVWRRYKLCCAAIHMQLRGWPPGGVQFNWEDAKPFDKPVPPGPRTEEWASNDIDDPNRPIREAT